MRSKIARRRSRCRARVARLCLTNDPTAEANFAEVCCAIAPVSPTREIDMANSLVARISWSMTGGRTSDFEPGTMIDAASREGARRVKGRHDRRQRLGKLARKADIPEFLPLRQTPIRLKSHV